MQQRANRVHTRAFRLLKNEVRHYGRRFAAAPLFRCAFEFSAVQHRACRPRESPGTKLAQHALTRCPCKGSGSKGHVIVYVAAYLAVVIPKTSRTLRPRKQQQANGF